MARKGRSKTGAREKEPLPPPLPPETRTVGQLIAESVRFYRHRFWQTLPLGLSVALVEQLTIELSRLDRPSREEVYRAVREGGGTAAEAVRIAAASVTAPDPEGISGAGIAFATLAGPLLLTLSYVVASSLAAGVRLQPRRVLVAYTAGVLAFLPVPFVASLLGFLSVLPAVAWLAFVGLAVPVAVIEGTGVSGSFLRATRLARADFVHAAGSLAALVIVYYVTRLALLVALRSAGEATERMAVLLADLVISPLLFVGAALLYFDQAARAVSSPPRRERRSDADLRHAHDPDRPRPPDAEVEPRPAAGGQPRR